MKLKVGGIRSTEQLQFRSRKSGPSKYQSLVEQAQKLRPGQSFTIDAPKDEKGRTALRNNIAAAIRRNVDPENGRLRLRITEDGKIAVSCLATKTKAKKAKTKKTKAKKAKTKKKGKR